MIYIAHRGFRVDVAENTFHAFDRAYAMRMDYIELDVQCSKDGELFVLHDKTLDRTMNARGELGKKKAAELTAVRTKQFNTFLPSLKKTLEHYLALTPHSINFMIELKGKNTGTKTACLIKEFNYAGRVVFSSRHLAKLKDAHKEAPAVPLCLNITSCRDFPPQKFLKVKSTNDLPLPFAMISLRASEITLGFIQQCRRFGILALAWDFIKTQNPIALMQQIAELGIDGILFDDPATAHQMRTDKETFLNIS